MRPQIVVYQRTFHERHREPWSVALEGEGESPDDGEGRRRLVSVVLGSFGSRAGAQAFADALSGCLASAPQRGDASSVKKPAEQPMQPIEWDGRGVVRFKRNPIVKYLLEKASEHGCDMNHLGVQDFSDEDLAHFAQLIGYSVGGFAELTYVSDALYERAEEGQRALLREQPSDPALSGKGKGEA